MEILFKEIYTDTVGFFVLLCGSFRFKLVNQENIVNVFFLLSDSQPCDQQCHRITLFQFIGKVSGNLFLYRKPVFYAVILFTT